MPILPTTPSIPPSLLWELQAGAFLGTADGSVPVSKGDVCRCPLHEACVLEAPPCLDVWCPPCCSL